MEELTPFRLALRAYVRGEADENVLRIQVNAEIIRGPSVALYERAEPDVGFSATLDAAMYLDMVLDGPDDPSALPEVAAGLNAVLESISPQDPWIGVLLDFARRPTLLDRLGMLLNGQIDRGAFNRYLDRYPQWPQPVHEALATMPRFELEHLASALEARDFLRVRALVFGDESPHA